MTGLNRRRVLRGMVGGGAVTVGLPLLNCFLNGNGTALAMGQPLPVRFGTWMWGLGMTKSVFQPKKYGAGYDLPEEIAALKDVRDHINLFTNVTAFRDTMENLCHYTGWVIMRTGIAPENQGHRPGETIDVTVANTLGRTTRFKSLTATATGDVRSSFSYENQNAPNNPEASALNFYTRIFGPDFPDPNAPTFTPNPRVMVRKSVLSGVMDDVKRLNAKVGAEDRQRLDEYFTSLRHLEQQFDVQLTKPEPLAACKPPAALKGEPSRGNDSELTAERHKLMTDLMVMAVACDQTRVFNMFYSNASANTTKAGYEKPHHTTTHEERVDDALGYQPNCSWFVRRAMESWAYFVSALAAIKEGDGHLIDNVLVYGTTDHGYARVHSLDNMPAFTAGRAGGKVRTGQHIDLGGTAGTRIGLTAMKVVGVDTNTWGANSNTTSKTVGEMLV
jgi:hypothetical protein